MHFDDHGQPPPGLNLRERQNRAVAELLGLIRGILVDGVVSEGEAVALRRWCEANPHVASEWPVPVLRRRIENIFEDGVVDAAEKRDLGELLRGIIGDDLCVSVGTNAPTTLPLDNPPPVIRPPGATFVFTGRFAFGPRRECERLTASLGGRCESTVTLRTNYLVIGTFSSTHWAQSSFGRKIEKAARYREHPRGQLAIVGEDSWAQIFD